MNISIWFLIAAVVSNSVAIYFMQKSIATLGRIVHTKRRLDDDYNEVSYGRTVRK